MKYMKIAALLMAMILLSGCWNSKPDVVNVIGECSWARFVHIEDEDIPPLVACCPYVAQQIVAHNDLYEEYCE